jgi:hypothetical protein
MTRYKLRNDGYLIESHLGDLVQYSDVQAMVNEVEITIGLKDTAITKLKRDVESLTNRRNDLIGQKAEIISALWNLVQSLPPSLQCADFPSHDGDAHFGPCPKVGKYMEAKDKAEEVISQFIRKPKP